MHFRRAQLPWLLAMKANLATPIALLVVSSFAGCTCSKEAQKVDAENSAAASASAPASDQAPLGSPPALDAQIFSAPIAAARMVNGHILAAGLVVPKEAITLTSLDVTGKVEWTVDALQGVRWSNDSELRVLPAGDGAAIVWHGPKDKKPGHFVAVIGPKGELRGGVLEIETMPCTTADALVWIESRANGPVRVKMRDFADGAVRDLASIEAESTPTLNCGEHAVHAFIEGDDQKTVRTLSGVGSDKGPHTVISAAEYADDQGREFEAYMVGDDLGMVRVGDDGDILIRELSHGRLGPWARLKRKLAIDEDVVKVDADKTSAVVVYLKDEGEDCTSGAPAKSVHALRVDRKTSKESSILLAPAQCGKDVGALWLADHAKSFVAAWIEPGSRADPAPIRGFVFRPLAGEASAPTRVAQAADAIVEAGCDGAACFAVALVRDPGADGMAPEALRLLRFP